MDRERERERERKQKKENEKDVGNKAGFAMNGGEISIQGSTGDEAGFSMSGGVLLVRGHSGDRLGCGMSGGSIVVMGSVGSEPGIGMTGGRVIISGSCPPPPDGVEMRSIKKSEISEFSKLLEPMGLSLNDDALVLEPAEGAFEGVEEAEFFISEGETYEDRPDKEGKDPKFSSIINTRTI